MSTRTVIETGVAERSEAQNERRDGRLWRDVQTFRWRRLPRCPRVSHGVRGHASQDVRRGHAVVASGHYGDDRLAAGRQRAAVRSRHRLKRRLGQHTGRNGSLVLVMAGMGVGMNVPRMAPGVCGVDRRVVPDMHAIPIRRAHERRTGADDGRRQRQRDGQEPRQKTGHRHHHHNFCRRSRNAFPMTDTELNVIAALAMIGLSRSPNAG